MSMAATKAKQDKNPMKIVYQLHHAETKSEYRSPYPCLLANHYLMPLSKWTNPLASRKYSLA
jgi:hypothetical protein